MLLLPELHEMDLSSLMYFMSYETQGVTNLPSHLSYLIEYIQRKKMTTNSISRLPVDIVNIQIINTIF